MSLRCSNYYYVPQWLQVCNIHFSGSSLKYCCSICFPACLALEKTSADTTMPIILHLHNLRSNSLCQQWISGAIELLVVPTTMSSRTEDSISRTNCPVTDILQILACHYPFSHPFSLIIFLDLASLFMRIWYFFKRTWNVAKGLKCADLKWMSDIITSFQCHGPSLILLALVSRPMVFSLLFRFETFCFRTRTCALRSWEWDS